jgi:hypothetical protein
LYVHKTTVALSLRSVRSAQYLKMVMVYRLSTKVNALNVWNALIIVLCGLYN